ncbi:MAG: YibE/F family protein [Patescibacteria group bacterium]|nr:YibE/F family protein [Patescibacteria group bacterium]
MLSNKIWTYIVWSVGIIGLMILLFNLRNANFQKQQGLEEIGDVGYESAVVVEAVDGEIDSEFIYFDYVAQDVKVQLNSGEVVDIGVQEYSAPNKVKAGDKVIVSTVLQVDGGKLYGLVDRNRTSSLLIIFGIFVLALLVLVGLKGFTSLAGLIFSIGVVAGFVVPQILGGSNALLISVLGALVIALVSIYMSHGVNKRSNIALVGTVITIFIAIGLAYFFVELAGLTGTGTEESIYAGFLGGTEGLNLKGLLLGGIIIGTLGILDDITVTQTSVVEQLSDANKTLGFSELYRKSFVVGKDHIVSMVNTLALAYVGAGLPLLLLFVTGAKPFWVVMNSQLVSEEVIRTLVGSVALILAVPITTYIAAKYFSKES